MKNDKKTLAKNPVAYHNYDIIDTIEAGIVLYGTEIKSIRMGKVNLKDSYAVIEKNREVFVYSMNISSYENGNIYNKDPLRPKKLLLNKREINKIIGMTSQKDIPWFQFLYISKEILWKWNSELEEEKNFTTKERI